ncbi:MAG: hypothetical protein N2439_07050, partial [Anaerolineae bacterium]|nr:hypothetical protein [Anaerolineae bacterium]
MKLHLSIRTHLFLLTILVALPFIGLLAYTAYVKAQMDVQRGRNMSSNIAQIVAAYTGQFIAEAADTLARLAGRPLVRAMDPGRCDPIFADVLALNP